MLVMPKLKLIVFDWDGTLVDSVNKIFECKKYLATKYNLAVPTQDIVRNALGKKFETALAICFPHTDQITLNQIALEFHTLIRQDKYQAALFPNVKETLLALQQQEIQLAVVTAKHREEFDKAIAFNNLIGTFNGTYCGDEGQSKPHPATLHKLMAIFNVTPGESLMIGDTITDMQFAANAGVRAIGVTFGAHTAAMLKTASPSALMDEWKQLPEVIKRLC
jgi:phosphoglycolate phosphatase